MAKQILDKIDKKAILAFAAAIAAGKDRQEAAEAAAAVYEQHKRHDMAAYSRDYE